MTQFLFLGYFYFVSLGHHPWHSHCVTQGASHSRKTASKHVGSVKRWFMDLVPICIIDTHLPVASAFLTWTLIQLHLHSQQWEPLFLLLWNSLWLPVSILWMWTEPSYLTPHFLFILLNCVNLLGTCHCSSCVDLNDLLASSPLLILSWFFWNLWQQLDFSYPFSHLYTVWSP